FGPGTDAGERVVWPYLRARGVARIDDLVVSHADADHAGGMLAVLDSLPVARTRASFPAGARAGRRPIAFAPCRAGQGWVLDGVTFSFLHPRTTADSGDSNADSCVLRVQGLHHSALLPGDIGVAQEN